MAAEQASRTLIVRARCRHCRQTKVIDVPALIERVGAHYSLVHRRCRCRLTPDCPGMVVFDYSTGTWYWHLYDDDDEARWVEYHD